MRVSINGDSGIPQNCSFIMFIVDNPKIVIFHSYVSLPEGNFLTFNRATEKRCFHQAAPGTAPVPTASLTALRGSAAKGRVDPGHTASAEWVRSPWHPGRVPVFFGNSGGKKTKHRGDKTYKSLKNMVMKVILNALKHTPIWHGPYSFLHKNVSSHANVPVSFWHPTLLGFPFQNIDLEFMGATTWPHVYVDCLTGQTRLVPEMIGNGGNYDQTHEWCLKLSKNMVTSPSDPPPPKKNKQKKNNFTPILESDFTCSYMFQSLFLGVFQNSDSVGSVLQLVPESAPGFQRRIHRPRAAQRRKRSGRSRGTAEEFSKGSGPWPPGMSNHKWFDKKNKTMGL